MPKYNYEIDMSVDTSATIILREITPGSTVLEFGPATGYMTKYLKQSLGCKIFCVEVDDQAAKIASQFSDKMIVADVDEMTWFHELKDKRFDHIVFADVLEHLRNPWDVLKKSVELLKENGTVLTSIPNFGHNAILMELFEGRFEYRKLGLLDNTHIRFFTARSVRDLLRNAGLCPVMWTGTVLSPEDTEFHQHYTNFSPTLKNNLLQVENGHVYQFVNVSKREEDVGTDERSNDFSIVNGGYVDRDFLELVDGQGISPIPIEYGEEFFLYKFSVDSSGSDKPCISLGIYQGYIEIESVELVSGNNTFTITNVDNQLYDQVKSDEMVLLDTSDNLRFLVTNENPKINIDISHFKKQMPSNYDLIIKMRISKDISKNLGKIIDNLNRYIIDLRNINKELETDVKELKEITDNQKFNIDALQTKIKQSDEQMSRILNSRSWRWTSIPRKIIKRVSGKKK